MSGERGKTSKGLLIVVMAAGLAGLFTGAFLAAGNLAAYALLLAAAVVNRINSRQGAYRAYFSTALGQAAFEVGGPETAGGRHV